jgi:hypothetical protein
MNKIVPAVFLILAFIFGYPVPNDMADETSEVSKLLGKRVQNPRGEVLGTIVDVVAGPEGCMAFAILSYWISADTQMRVAVPFGALSCEGQNCILNVNKEMLASAPIFILEDDLAEEKLAEDIYRYFGLQPYWMEERREQ